MAVFKTKSFMRFARKEHIRDAELLARALQKDIDVTALNARSGYVAQAPPGGFDNIADEARIVLVFREGSHGFFVYGFEKDDKSELTDEESLAFRKLASEYLILQGEALNIAILGGELIELVNWQ